jgi:hypothetical protein
MDAYEKRALIEQLQEKSEAGRAEISRREQEREDNPALMQDYLMARDYSAPDAGLEYKDFENPPLPNTQPATYLDQPCFTEAQADSICELVVRYYKRECKQREQALEPLKQRIAKLEGQISVLLALQQREPKQ